MRDTKLPFGDANKLQEKNDYFWAPSYAEPLNYCILAGEYYYPISKARNETPQYLIYICFASRLTLRRYLLSVYLFQLKYIGSF